MASGIHCEIELKYLIRRPDPAFLSALPGCEVWEITQIYLTPGPGDQTRRVRKVVTGGSTRYYRTFKRFITAMSSAEDEGEITEEAYAAYLQERDPESRPIEKTRFRVPFGGHTLEFDLYPFWTDRAILEIELAREDEAANLPDYVGVIRNVTGDLRYRNRALAREVPMDVI